MQGVPPKPASSYRRLRRRTGVPPAVPALAIAIFLFFGLGPNSSLALIATIVLIVGCVLLWRPGESPILLFMFALPWLQATTSIFYANWLGIRVDDLTLFYGDMQGAILLSLAGLLFLAFGLRLGAGLWTWQEAFQLREQAHAQPLERWLFLYVIAWAISFAALAFAWIVPGFSQVMIALAGMKWAFFFILAYVGFAGVPGGRRWLALVFLVELALATGGYFSDFRTVFFVTMFAALASGVRLSLGALIGLSIMGAMLLTFAIVWTSVKGEYRKFLSGGEVAQAVTVDYESRMEKLAEMISQLNSARLAEGTDELVRRLSYTEFFSVVLVNVPTRVPHANGVIFWDALTRPFMPRLFFPDKSVIDDTSRTAYYTGLALAGAEEATSFSLGWIAEIYIDFGSFSIFPVSFLIGVFYGRIYRSLFRGRASGGLLGTALATSVLIGSGASFLETSFTKTFGALMTALIVAWALVKFILPRWAPWLLARPHLSS
jgi:hypothetical protein